MSSCVPGTNEWNKLPPMVKWVEKEKPPDYIVATYKGAGKVNNERLLFPSP
jgi:hypothetical protein